MIKYYGAYDCVPNAIVYLLETFSLSPEPFYFFNWDIEYDPGKDRLSGSSYDVILYLEKVYNLKVDQLSISTAFSSRDYFLIVLSMYDLDYSRFYQIKEQDHCVVAKMSTPNTVEIIDPYFCCKTIMDANLCFLSWSKYKDPIYSIRPSRNKGYKAKISPVILESNFISKYEVALTLNERLETIQSINELDKTYYFDKYFGMLNSIYMARANHFSAIPELSRKHKLIMSTWIQIQKLFIAGQPLSNLIEQVYRLEIDYLNSYFPDKGK